MGKLGIYLVANYPTKEAFLGAVRACEELGVDFLEVGFPFSDPVADGDVLEKASVATLKQFKLDDFIAAFRKARAIFTKKLYIMTYTNVVYSAGLDRFSERIGPCDGLILADLPLREIARVGKGTKNTSVDLIRFLTPESRPEDVSEALKGAREFIYFVSKRGTTGGQFGLDAETKGKIAAVRGRGVPVYIGFGIQERQDLEVAYGAADGAIIGTKAVAELEGGVDRFRAYLGSLLS